MKTLPIISDAGSSPARMNAKIFSTWPTRMVSEPATADRRPTSPADSPMIVCGRNGEPPVRISGGGEKPVHSGTDQPDEGAGARSQQNPRDDHDDHVQGDDRSGDHRVGEKLHDLSEDNVQGCQHGHISNLTRRHSRLLHDTVLRLRTHAAPVQSPEAHPDFAEFPHSPSNTKEGTHCLPPKSTSR